MKYEFIGSISRKSERNDYDDYVHEQGIEGIIEELNLNRSGVFVAPPNCGRTHFLFCIEQQLIKSKFECIYIDLSSVREAGYLLRDEQIQKALDQKNIIILLDGFEYIDNTNSSLFSILVSLEEKFKNSKLQFIITCLPIDYLYSRPHEVLSSFLDKRSLFEVVRKPFTFDEIENYIESLPTPEWSVSPIPEYKEILNWISNHGLKEL